MLQGKVAIVTGAAQGIGEAIARRFASEGATVCVAQRNEESAKRLVDDLTAGGHFAHWIRTDVRDGEQVKQLIQEVVSRVGQVDVLCNNAGVSLSRSILDTTDEDYELVMDTNFRGVFNCCKHALPQMIKQRSGSIINIASIAGLLALPGEAIYSASKGAVVMLTRQLALEYAEFGVRVNAICPSFVAGPALDRWIDRQPNRSTALDGLNRFHPMGRVSKPEEIGAAATFLASDDSSFVTGICLPVDGGVGIKA
jgi:NAD(P)-dependent dehydrogenase (short-subunit alcohol dehydrogenase family)